MSGFFIFVTPKTVFVVNACKQATVGFYGTMHAQRMGFNFSAHSGLWTFGGFAKKEFCVALAIGEMCPPL